MGVRWVTVDGPFECKARKLEVIPRPEGGVRGDPSAAGYLVRAGCNDDYRLINRMYREGVAFSFASSGNALDVEDGGYVPPGSLLVHDGRQVRDRLPDLLDGVSSTLVGTEVRHSDAESVLHRACAPRTGLYRPWMANLDEGWTRFVLDAFEFAYTSVHNAEIRAGNLRTRYDCLILPSMSTRMLLNGQMPDATEPQYVGGIGSDGIFELQRFVEDGGTLVCIDASCTLPIDRFGLPVVNLVDGLPQTEFFCRGSSLRTRVDTEHPVGYGMPEWTSAYFYEAQVFDLIDSEEESAGAGRSAAVVARYADTALVESGRIRSGEDLIAGRPAIVEMQYGAGRIVLLGFGIQRNAQTHGTFRFLFNAIQRSTLEAGGEFI